MKTQEGITLEALANAKKLHSATLRDAGCRNMIGNIAKGYMPSVSIPYRGEDGTELAVRYRTAITGANRFRWRKGDKVHLYGLARLPSVRAAGWVLLVEGETDCWTAWQHGLPALGVPGKDTWQDTWTRHIDGLEVYLWKEPDADKLPGKVYDAGIHDLRVIAAPNQWKDLNEAQCDGQDICALVARLKCEALPYSTILEQRRQQTLQERYAAALPLLECDDPLKRIEDGLRAYGYGGVITPAIVTYLAATSRLLKMGRGQMPVHLIIIGAASTGKTWTVTVVRRHLPADAYHQIDAASPRALIYDEADLRHVAIIFSEADSLPAGEDSAPASAVRALLQDHQLAYDVVERAEETGGFATRHIVKPGPSVMITTSTRRLYGGQMDSRMFILEMTESQEQVCAALAKQAELELTGSDEPDAALIAFQSYLQAGAPWDVVVPFVDRLAAEIGRSPSATRILRDFQRLLSLIKTVALLRHKHRTTDNRGRIVADALEDYGFVRNLVNDMYSGSLTGASKGIRNVVEAVANIAATRKSGEAVMVKDVAERLKIGKMQAHRYVRQAVTGGWLINDEQRKGQPAKLRVGEPLPPETGLPTPESLTVTASVTVASSLGAHLETTSGRLAHEVGNAITPDTGSLDALWDASNAAEEELLVEKVDGWEEEI